MKKRKGELSEAYRRSAEVTKKTIFALRLLTAAPVYAEYRGFRTVGHYSGGASGMILMNYPGERIDRGYGCDFESCMGSLERLIPPTLATPIDSITVVYDKLDDALRRHREGGGFGGIETREAIDQLLDYFQALEAIIQAEGSYQIALYAAVLLNSAKQGRELAGTAVFDFVKDMHTLRNEVIHGRIDKVLDGRSKTKHKITEIELFRHYIYQLAILYILNPDENGQHGLRLLGHRLALGEPVKVKTLREA